MSKFSVGDRVIAKIDMINDLTDHGMGVEVCACQGESLIIREVFPNERYSVSHEHIKDRTFRVTDGEIEPAHPQGEGEK